MALQVTNTNHAVWGKAYWLTGSQWEAEQLFNRQMQLLVRDSYGFFSGIGSILWIYVLKYQVKQLCEKYVLTFGYGILKPFPTCLFTKNMANVFA